ncbi:hypothetical protein SynBIOSE41_00237 [Synechococcus sp. BIOS-E4-1]|nr:hypothetical protein SynBIOSE41_00237 [Synechococcus sp. BIOS-E4-1]
MCSGQLGADAPSGTMIGWSLSIQEIQLFYIIKVDHKLLSELRWR